MMNKPRIANPKERRKSLVKKQNERMLKRLLEVEYPIRMSLITAGFWIVILTVLGIVLEQLNKNGYLVNFMSAFAVGIALAILWLLLRFGLAERWRVKLKNYRNSRIVQKAELSSNKKFLMTLEEYRVFMKKHSWVGIWVLLATSSSVVLITALVYYL